MRDELIEPIEKVTQLEKCKKIWLVIWKHQKEKKHWAK